MTDSVRAAAEDVLSRDMTREIWSGNYDKALPFSLHHFQLSAILPAVFYMFRFGQRRGAGNFLKTFGLPTGTPSQKRRSATIDRISESARRRGGVGSASTERPRGPSWAICCFASVWRTSSTAWAETSRCNALRRPTTWRAGSIFLRASRTSAMFLR